MKGRASSFRVNKHFAEQLWGELSEPQLMSLKQLTTTYGLSVGRGDLICLVGHWYVTHSGLLRLSSRRKCSGISVEIVPNLCDPSNNRWVFKATVFRAGRSKGFVGFADADPANVSALVRGAEMRVAETRAVNRALRKAYGIGICSVEELGSVDRAADFVRETKKPSPQPVNGKGWNNGPKVRDQLCRLIRQHQLDATLVKAYATDFCSVKSLREASREQVEHFVQHLSDWAEKDRNALLCQLNSYLGVKEKEAKEAKEAGAA